MKVKIRFECGSEERTSPEYGPFEYVQLTYNELQVESETLATLHEGVWHIDSSLQLDTDDWWSDIVIFSEG